MCQFHLHFSVGSLGPLGKDFQDETGAVYNIAAGNDLFNVALLHTREFVIENDVLYFVFFAVLLNLIQFSRADVRGLVGPVQPLGEHFVGNGAGCLGQESELVQVFLYLALSPFFQDDAYKYCFVGLKFTHIGCKDTKKKRLTQK